ncbi:Integrase catalytic core [Trinorchestia longiramus]|nr:Integrase catalytic core [Trinorchestia longiramus]
MIDRFTCWVEAVPISDITAETVARTFVHSWIARFGVPLRITHDRGAQFASKLWADVSSLLGCVNFSTTAFHPQSNGLIERVHHDLKTALKCLNSRTDWVDHLPMVLLSLRNLYKQDKKATTSEMLYGQSLRLPGDIVNPDVSTSFSLQNQNSYSDRPKRCMTQIRYVARCPTQTVDKLDPALETCTHVYVRVDAVKPALTHRYEGPFLVIRRTAKYFLIEKHGKQDSVSIDRLKAAFVSDALIPNNLPPPDVTDLSVDDNSLLKPPVRRLEFASQLAALLPSSIPCNPFLIPSRCSHGGVIKGIHPSVNVEDIKASADCGSSELLSVTRLSWYSGGIKEESSAVKLGFAGTQCPSHVYVGFTRHAVFHFKAPPCCCYCCQRLGHIAVNCNSPLCYLVCSGPHTKDECTAEPEQEKCANCHQTHIVSSEECSAIRNAAAIQKLQCSGVGFEVAKHKLQTPREQIPKSSPGRDAGYLSSRYNKNNSPTYIDRRVGTTTLDLFFATHNLVGSSVVRTGPDLGSDRFPVCCTLGVVPVRLPMGAAQHWKLGAADWTKWTSHLNVHTDQTHVGPCNAIMGNNFLLGAINSTAEKLVPMSAGRTGISRATLWWDAACSTAVAQLRCAKGNFFAALHKKT